MTEQASEAEHSDQFGVQAAKSQLARLRIKELNEVCAQLGLRKTGRKQELTDRVVRYLEQASELAHSGADPNQVRQVVSVLESVYGRMIADGASGRGILFFPPVVQPAAMAPQPTQPPAPPTGTAYSNHPRGSAPQLPIPILGPRHAQQQPAQQASQQQGGPQQARGPRAPPPPPPARAQGSMQLDAAERTAAAWAAGGHATAGNGNTSTQRPAGSTAVAHALMKGYQGVRTNTGTASGYPPGLNLASPAQQARPAAGMGSASLPVRCVCGHNNVRGEMVQCAGCKVAQHADCVALPALQPGQTRQGHTHFCEKCRAERADPYWQPLETIMIPAKLVPTGRSTMVGTKMEPVQTLDQQFQVSPHHYDMFKRQPQRFRLQVICLQLNDSCPFRFHWPTGCELRVNSLQYRVTARGPQAKMGPNQRDEPANISILVSSGKTSRLTIQAADANSYVVTIMLCKSRGADEVKALMKPPETLAQAIARVRKQLAGGGDDTDDDLLVTQTRVPLRCPLSGGRINTPARFVDVPGMSCFDLDSFLSMAERSRKWQCPNSMRNSSIFNLQIDTYLATLLDTLASYPDISEVEINVDARWRPVLQNAPADQPWHTAGEAYAAPAQGIAIKAEPGVGQHEANRPNGAASSDEESEDELEELRKAVAAMKRGRAPSPEVIDLLDSSDDEVNSARGAKRPNLGTSGVSAANRAAPPPPPGGLSPGAQQWQGLVSHVQQVGSPPVPGRAGSGPSSHAAAARPHVPSQVQVPGLGAPPHTAHTAGGLAVPGVHFVTGPNGTTISVTALQPSTGRGLQSLPPHLQQAQQHAVQHQHQQDAADGIPNGGLHVGNGVAGAGDAQQRQQAATNGRTGANFFQPRVNPHNASRPQGRLQPNNRPAAQETIVIELSDSD